MRRNSTLHSSSSPSLHLMAFYLLLHLAPRSIHRISAAFVNLRPAKKPRCRPGGPLRLHRGPQGVPGSRRLLGNVREYYAIIREAIRALQSCGGPRFATDTAEALPSPHAPISDARRCTGKCISQSADAPICRTCVLASFVNSRV